MRQDRAAYLQIKLAAFVFDEIEDIRKRDRREEGPTDDVAAGVYAGNVAKNAVELIGRVLSPKHTAAPPSVVV